MEELNLHDAFGGAFRMRLEKRLEEEKSHAEKWLW